MEVILPKSGRYVAAVSGGVDSVSLLHMLKDQLGLKLVVSHFDHGIRPDSRSDREFVQGLAAEYDLPFVYEEGRLGRGASEAAAREARYAFLDRARQAHGAIAIVTAHHLDDVLETAVINLLRGSRRKGLTALAARPGIERPLLSTSKAELIDYARINGLEWREDSTNQDIDHLRNYVRHQLLPRMDVAGRNQLWEIISDLRPTNREIDDLLLAQLEPRLESGRLDRDWFIQLPHSVATETMAAWLRREGLRDFDSKTLERLVVAAKTARPGKTFDILKGARLDVAGRDLALTGLER